MKVTDNNSFLQKLNLTNTHFKNNEFICKTPYTNQKNKIIVKDGFGFCAILPGGLLKGNPTSLKSAIFKENYLQNKLRFIHGYKYIYQIVEYKNANCIVMKSEFGLHVTNLSNLYDRCNLCISSAIDKTSYALREFEKKCYTN